MEACIACGAEAVISQQDNASRTIYNCPMCGTFVVSDLVDDAVRDHAPKVAAFLAHRRLQENAHIVMITYENASKDKDYVQLTLNQLISAFPDTFTETMDRVLENLTRLSSYGGEEYRVEGLEQAPFFFLQKVNFDALSYMIKAMQAAHLIDVNFYSSAFFPCGVVVSPGGWDRIARIKKGQDESKNAFVVYGRGEEAWNVSMRMATRKALMNCNYEVTENLASHPGNLVNHALIAQVKRSKIVVCDLSDGGGEAYYVAGMATALKKCVALVCHDSYKRQLKTERNEFPVIIWKEKQELYNKLQNLILAYDL